MVKQPPTARRNLKIARLDISIWQRNRAKFDSPRYGGLGLGLSRCRYSKHTHTIRPEDTVEYEGSMLTEIRPGVFYVPKVSNQVAFYPFILADDVLHTFKFQITIAASHEIKEGILDFFSQPVFSSSVAKFGVAFRLYYPLGETVLCPESSSAMLGRFWKVKLFSAEFDPRSEC